MKIKGKKLVLLAGAVVVAVFFIMVSLYMIRAEKGVKEKPQEQEAGPSSPTDVTKAREHFEKGLQFSLKREYEAAIEEYKKSLEFNPSIPEVHNNLGFAYLDKGNIDNAISEQKKALEINPNLANGYYGLALALEKKNDIDGAINAWKSYLNLAQPHSRWWIKAKERLDNLEKQKKGS